MIIPKEYSITGLTGAELDQLSNRVRSAGLTDEGPLERVQDPRGDAYIFQRVLPDEGGVACVTIFKNAGEVHADQIESTSPLGGFFEELQKAHPDSA